MTRAGWRRIPRTLRWIGGILALLVLLLVGMALISWNAARPIVSRVLSAKLNRPVHIDGDLRVRLFSSTPSVSVAGLRIGNPRWVDGDMLTLPHLALSIQLSQLLRARLVLQTLELQQPQLILVRDGGGRANWELSNADGKPADSAGATKLPPILHFALRGGQLQVSDAVRRLTFDGKVTADQGMGGTTSQPFGLMGKGSLNKEPFQLTFDGGALLNVQPDQPYRFKASVDAGASSARIDGSLAKPFDLGRLDADLELTGQNLANLYYLTGLSLPLTPPYRLSVHLQRAERHFALHQIAGRVGHSDLRGEATVDVDRTGRPTLQATLVSKSLNLADLGVAFGAGVESQGSAAGAPQLPAPAKQPLSPYLLPTFEFQFDRLAAMDASVDFRADSVQAQKVPFQAVSLTLRLNHGVLDLDPVNMQLPLGKLAGQVHLDTRGSAPEAILDLRLSDVQLEQFKGKGDSPAPLSGVLQSRARFEGRGNSVHAIAADADGTITAVIPHGEIRRSLAELTGINVLTGLGLLLTKSDQTADIRCGVAQFKLKDGVARADQILLDTHSVLVTGRGQISLATEDLDLDISGKPKQFRFGRLRTPINVRGTLRHPSIGISAPDAIKQGGVAAAAGVLLTPLAAVIAFVDPGLAKDQDCAALLEDAQAQPASLPTHDPAGNPSSR